MFAFKSSAVVVALVISAVAIPVPNAGPQPFTLQNGKDAIALNDKFKGLTPDSSCTSGDDACIDGKFAQCANSKFVLTSCGAGTICSALPLVNSPGTSVTCTTEADKNARIAATGASGDSSDSAAPAPAPAPAAPAPAPADNAVDSGNAASGAKSFTVQNGKDAIALNDKFQTLTPDSPCTSGDDACIDGKFAQCANSKFVLTSCGAGTICSALPLVNSAGTSVTCTTEADKNARIAATGASGDSSDSAAPAPAPAPAAPAPAPADNAVDSGEAASGAKSFTLKNGQDAQALNAKFTGLTPESSCTTGENACINEAFAQCVDGKFVLTPCQGAICAALPLVNSPGTSITCTDKAQALQRIQATGAGNSLTGN